jgi:hypothetical protein
MAGAKRLPSLVGPDHDLDRRLGLDAVVVQAAHDLERRQHAVGAVELAAGRLAVQVAAGHDRRRLRVAAGPPGEDVAHGVEGDAAAGRLGPAGEEVAAVPVEIGQRQAADPAFGGGADLRHLHQAVPQPLAVDGEILHGPALALRPA